MAPASNKLTRDSLTEIANHYGTDKGTLGPTNDWQGHNYTDIYSAYLEGRRLESINLLEIGLGVTGDRWKTYIVRGRNTGGASLKMWHDYFPNAMIFGVDINECSYLDNARTSTFIVDQGDRQDLRRFLDATKDIEFDVIIDDGSHNPEHQQTTLDVLFCKLKPGGYYFIEDLLSNGVGDGATGRTASNRAVNTRRCLQHYLECGEFSKPNCFENENYLKEHIDQICFHSPAISAKISVSWNLQSPVEMNVNYRDNDPKLCAIRKK